MDSPKFGQSGIVVREKDFAYKGPFYETIKDIDFENSVYEKLGPNSRIAKYLGFEEGRIKLELYREGDVSSKISDEEFAIPLIEWAHQILEGLLFVHGKGVTHGDLRCANILVTDELDVVLADFGSAAINGTKGTDTYYDIRHRSPRYDEATHTIAPQDDLFAFGTILYHLSTRKLPLEGSSERDVWLSYSNGDFPNVSELELGTIIEKCWRGSYKSAVEIQHDLSTYHPSQKVYI